MRRRALSKIEVFPGQFPSEVGNLSGAFIFVVDLGPPSLENRHPYPQNKQQKKTERKHKHSTPNSNED